MSLRHSYTTHKPATMAAKEPLGYFRKTTTRKMTTLLAMNPQLQPHQESQDNDADIAQPHTDETMASLSKDQKDMALTQACEVYYTRT